MKLAYVSPKDESCFTLTDFNCEPSLQLVRDKGLYKILWCKGDSVSLMVDGYSMQLKKNQVLFCTPLNILELSVTSNLMAIVFNREFYCIQEHDEEISCQGFLFYGSSVSPVITLDEKDVQRFETIFYIFQEEFETKDHIQGEMLRVMLKRLLIQSTRLIKKEVGVASMPNAQLDIIRQYNILVEKNFREKHQVAAYAELLFKSPKTLSNLFKQAGNQSPLKVINDRIIVEAKRLLLYSNKTAEEIAYELGYKEAAHFSKFFKKQVGEPPVEFKKRMTTVTS